MSINTDAGQKKAINQLERQVERGSFFVHTALSENADLLNELQSFTFGLIDILIQHRLISEEEMTAAVTRVRKQMESNGEMAIPRIALRIDRTTTTADTYIPADCNGHIQTCKGICCKLNFALNREEIEAGQVKWDLGRPYFIRQEQNGFCGHHDLETHRCQIYSERPAVCRYYSCQDDERIWKDFEKMELNLEWLETNLSQAVEPRMVQALMHGIECFVDAGEVEKQPLNEVGTK